MNSLLNPNTSRFLNLENVHVHCQTTVVAFNNPPSSPSPSTAADLAPWATLPSLPSIGAQPLSTVSLHNLHLAPKCTRALKICMRFSSQPNWQLIFSSQQLDCKHSRNFASWARPFLVRNFSIRTGLCNRQPQDCVFFNPCYYRMFSYPLNWPSIV